MRAPVLLLLALSWSIAAVGCGKSPLVSHSNEERPQTAQVQQQHPGGCALSYALGGRGACASLAWVLGPAVGENKLRLDFDADVSALAFEATAEMPDMGHGTAPPTITRVSATSIEISDLWLVMAGRWVLHLKLGGVDVTREVRI
ncbi:MAG: hypothetical protein HY075_10760 [Deltaproteobacteria bacterium]|nr:hypothetical protein [Deltaproteobacteria bacterium]